MTAGGSRGRIVVGTLGLDQHEVGAIAVAHLLRREGFEVIYLGKNNTPRSFAATVESEDADVIGVSVHSWELAAYVDDLVTSARDLGVAVAIGGSILTKADAADLEARGVDAVFGPWAGEEQIVTTLDRLVAGVRERQAPHRINSEPA